VAVTVLVRNPNARHTGCRILYRDIGDYLKREEKLAILRKAGSVAGLEGWREITPDRHHDWIDQRDPAFLGFLPLGTKRWRKIFQPPSTLRISDLYVAHSVSVLPSDSFR